MFEEICLTCSKQLADDGRAYCSDECELLDSHTSPSMSSASSALSSPFIEHTKGGEVPPLVPSALGSALQRYNKRDRYSVSSSSTSSASWSVFTDDQEDDHIAINDGLSDDDGSDAHAEHVRSHTGLHSSAPGLIYARRPSATNNRSVIPLLHRLPSSSSAEIDLEYDDTTSQQDNPLDGTPEKVSDRSTLTSKSKKSRNRTSLPACFTRLQISSPQRSPPAVASTDSTTPAKMSPPTPRLATLLSIASRSQITPRGRRPEPGCSRSSHRSRSPSRSRSRHATLVPEGRGRPADLRESIEHMFSSAAVSRGRPARRNSSPLPKMVLHVGDRSGAISESGNHTRLTRGRMRIHELDGPGSTLDAPAYGNGRSGLRERERLRLTGIAVLQ
ncbi:hypothetical protein CONPUDRAFT_162238 [Coniophora puteana RWD-64-598 SS2]|uniref:Uncharacterized protein n=1 Tax=Coniophora puteana (strain RWD-64-598) TaxID=741705 RepID=A0A5M3N0M2_CONPW|nr:uncharacterized protein CONPUDRAFT_162238 [Coniophora puteana RWD-64-598 SS2]EIW84918.1 hypothetical protein CONPUDRAFT_162238 [Coniophora puteana RWD-64-598 SS2]